MPNPRSQRGGCQGPTASKRGLEQQDLHEKQTQRKAQAAINKPLQEAVRTFLLSHELREFTPITRRLGLEELVEQAR